jgi:Domain of unknown function (DUF4232)
MVIVLAACGSDNSAPSVGTTAAPTTTATSTTTTAARTTTTAARTTTSTGTPSTTSRSTSTSPATTSPSTTAASDRCHTNELKGSLGTPSPGAGNLYVPLVLTNVSNRQCVIAGYPGVSLLDAAGAQIEQPAGREPGFPSNAVPVAPGASASTVLHTTQEGIAPGPCWPLSAQIKVFPPNELDALTFPGQFKVCGDAFTIRPLVAGTTGGS